MNLLRWTGRSNVLLVFERGCLALANILAVIVAARFLGERDFGVFTTVLSIWFFAEVILLSVIVEPLIAFSGKLRWPAHFNASWCALSAVSTVTITIAFTVLALFTLSPQDYGREVAASVVYFVPAYGLFHTTRRLLTRQEDRFASLRSVCVLCVVLVFGVGALYLGFVDPTVHMFCLVLAVAHAAGAAYALLIAGLRMSLSPHYFRALVSRLWRRRDASMSSLIVNAFGLGIFGWALGVLSGPVEVARFIASKTLMRPLGSIITALDDGGRNDAARATVESGSGGLSDWFRDNRHLAVFISIPILGAAFLFPDVLLRAVYAGKFDDLVPLVRIWCVYYFASSLLLPRRIYMLTTGRERELMRIGFWAACATLAVIVIESTVMGRFSASTFILAGLASVVTQIVLIEFVLRSPRAVRWLAGQTVSRLG